MRAALRERGEKRREKNREKRRIRRGDAARDASSDAPIFRAFVSHGDVALGDDDGRIERSETNASPIERRPCQKSRSPAGGEKEEEKKRATRPGIFPFARMRDHHHAIATIHHRYRSPLPPPLPITIAIAITTVTVANVKNIK